MDTLPQLLAPAELADRLGDPDLRLVDLTPAEHHAEAHLPGAVHLDYGAIVAQRPPVMGLLPDGEHLERVFSELGIAPDTPVVAYDHEGGGRAARLLWTLEAAGHRGPRALLDGGIHAWRAEGRPTEATATRIEPRRFRYQTNEAVIADRDYILAHLDDPRVILVDARSPAEYAGIDVRAARGGHIPGAVNLDWVECIDRNRDLRLKSELTLRQLFQTRGVTPEKTVITYCQTHHRSALVYWVLKILGYPRVKGYPGSWSDWGNALDTPIEQG